MKKRIISLIVCIVMIAVSVASVSSCSKPPEYAEIEGRFRELVEASYEINEVLFGEGLPTYERIYDPWGNMQVQKSEDENGKVSYLYYCYITDPIYGEILAYKKGATQPTQYLQILGSSDPQREAVYVDSEAGKYYYNTDYKESDDVFYYPLNSPDNYDYVSADSPYLSVDAIKEAAEKVYSRDYLETSVYEALFMGASVSEDLSSLSGLAARYIDYGDANTGDSSFMMSNEYEALITETRIFDFSTARVVKPGNKKIVNIEVETYLESKPQERVTVRVTMVKQDGQWYLDSGTY